MTYNRKTGSYILGYLNAKFQPEGSQITRLLYAGFFTVFYFKRSLSYCKARNAKWVIFGGYFFYY